MAYPDDLLHQGFVSRNLRDGVYRRFELHEWVGGAVPTSGDVQGLDGFPLRGSADPNQPSGMDPGVLLESGIRQSFARNKAVVRLVWGTPRGDFAGFGSQLGTWKLDPIKDSNGSARIQEVLPLRVDVEVDATVSTTSQRGWSYVRPQWFMSYRNTTPGETKDVMNQASALYGRIAVIRGVRHILLDVEAADRTDGLVDVRATFWSSSVMPSFPAGTIDGYPYPLPALGNLDSYLVTNSPSLGEVVVAKTGEDTYGDIVPPSQWNLIGVDNLG